MEQYQSFRDFLGLNESPVGQVGRTSHKDAEEYITDEKISEFSKLVKKLGGKTVARLLLNKLNSNGDKLKDDGDETLDDIEGMDIKNVNESKDIKTAYFDAMNSIRALAKTIDANGEDSTELRKITKKFEMELLSIVSKFQ